MCKVKPEQESHNQKIDLIDWHRLSATKSVFKWCCDSIESRNFSLSKQDLDSDMQRMNNHDAKKKCWTNWQIERVFQLVKTTKFYISKYSGGIIRELRKKISWSSFLIRLFFNRLQYFHVSILLELIGFLHLRFCLCLWVDIVSRGRYHGKNLKTFERKTSRISRIWMEIQRSEKPQQTHENVFHAKLPKKCHFTIIL